MNERTERCVSPQDPSQRESVAAYALGALDPVEADLVALHLGACAACRTEYMDALDMLPLLASVTEEEAVSGPVRPDPDLLGQVLALRPPQAPAGFAAPAPAEAQSPLPHPSVRHARGVRGTGSGSRRSRLVMATAAVFLAVVGSFVGVQLASSPAAPSSAGWSASAESAVYNGQEISASIQVSPASWGSRLTLRMDNVPKGYQCAMVVIGMDGKAQGAGSWKAPTTGNFTIPGTASLSPDQISAIRVRLPNGVILLTFNHAKAKGTA